MQDSLRRFKADIFQALAHPTRIAIIELLEDGELSAGELIGKLGMEQANISQHLAVLRSKQSGGEPQSGESGLLCRSRPDHHQGSCSDAPLFPKASQRGAGTAG